MPTRKAEAEWKGNLAEGSGRLKGDEVLRIHKEVFYGALKSQNYAALKNCTRTITCSCGLMVLS